MLYFIWSLLNLGALVWFLFICFSNLSGMKEKLGLASTIIFVVCCLSFIRESLSNKSLFFSFDTEMANQTTKMYNIENVLFFNLDLMYSFSKDSIKTEISAITVINGFVIGHEWKPLTTKVYVKKGIVHYAIAGDHNWEFLGLTLYTDRREFTGTIK